MDIPDPQPRRSGQMITTEAYAIVENNEIDVRTVSPTVRAAQVNYLVVNRGHMILNTTPDREIEYLWEVMTAPPSVRTVTITCQE